MRYAHSEFRDGWRVVFAAAVGVGVGVTGSVFYTISVFMKPLAAEFHWSRAAVSGGSLFLSLGWTLTAPLIGLLADRWDVRKVGLISLVGLITGLVGLTRINSEIWSFYLCLTLLAVAGSGTAR